MCAAASPFVIFCCAAGVEMFAILEALSVLFLSPECCCFVARCGTFGCCFFVEDTFPRRGYYTLIHNTKIICGQMTRYWSFNLIYLACFRSGTTVVVIPPLRRSSSAGGWLRWLTDCTAPGPAERGNRCAGLCVCVSLFLSSFWKISIR